MKNIIKYLCDILRFRTSMKVGADFEKNSEVAQWHRQATEQGDATAQFLLGFIYSKGRGVPQDFAEAAKWYRLAAAQGFTEAQTRLESLESDDKGAPQNDAAQ